MRTDVRVRSANGKASTGRTYIGRGLNRRPTRPGREDHCVCDRRGSSLLVSLLISWFAFTSAVTTSAQATIPLDEISPALATRLQAQIERGSSEEKRTALSEIRNLRSPSASRIALPALRDKNELVRATAAASVIFLPSNEAASALVPLLNDRAEFVRREAAYALGDAGHPSATVPLVGLIRTDKVLEVRTAATVALGKIGDTAAVGSLLAVLRSRPREEDEFLRRSAARAIGQIAQIKETSDRSVVTPQNFLPDKFKEIGPGNSRPRPTEFSAAVDVLINVLRSSAESDDTRREAAFALGAIGDEKAVPTLQNFVSNDDPYMKEIAREALDRKSVV